VYAYTRGVEAFSKYLEAITKVCAPEVGATTIIIISTWRYSPT
jgi:hypothetical protein